MFYCMKHWYMAVHVAKSRAKQTQYKCTVGLSTYLSVKLHSFTKLVWAR